MQGPNAGTEKLLKKLNASGKLHCVPSALKGKYVIRFTVTSQQTTEDDIRRDWNVIQALAKDIVPHRITLAEVKRQEPEFGTSLLLSNSPLTPKVMNGSYVAFFDGTNVWKDLVSRYSDHFTLGSTDSPALRRRVRGLMVSQKQYSLDSRMDLMNSLVAASVVGKYPPASAGALA